MKEERLVNLVKTLSIQTTSYNTKRMIKFIKNEVSKIPGCVLVEDKENIYVTKGEAKSYPCMVAHTDTVHKLVKDFRIYRSGDRLFSIDGNSMKRVGIGGDDKVGVFIALEMLRNTEVCKAVFFRDEEVGCKGSADADMRWFDDVEFALQCDRKGAKDFVNNIYGNVMYDSAFSAAIGGILSKYGRKEVDGGMTDVCELVEKGLPVAAANMSCGYYDPHTDNEYVIISEIDETYEMCKEIVDGLSGQRWEVSDQERYMSSSSRYGYLGGWIGDDIITDRHRGLDARHFNDPVIEDFSDSGYCCPDCHSQNLGYDEFENMLYCFNCDVYMELEDAVPEDLVIVFDDEEDDELEEIEFTVKGADEEEGDNPQETRELEFADTSDVKEMEDEAKRLGASKGKSTKKKKGNGGNVAKSDLSKLADKL